MKKTNITICQGSSCFSRGNKQNLVVIQNFLAVHNLIAEVTFKGQLCNELCNDSPIIIIDNKTHTNIDEASTLELLKSHFKID